MAFNVRFYVHNKEVNSTAIPSGEGTLFECEANDRVDIISPVIALQRGLGGAVSPVAFNYCYIQPFNRFYFVQNWEYMDGLWHAHCQVDVLGTYRSEIGELEAYVLRSAYVYDGSISDGMYPAKNTHTFGTATAANPWNTELYWGTIVVGIAGAGSTYYYKFSYANFILFMVNLMSDAYASTVIGELGIQAYSEAKVIVDPIQYVTSVIFIPIQDWDGMANHTIKVGYGEITANCELVTSAATVTNKTISFSSIPKHPSATNRGEYLNHSPWTRYILDMPPFGSLELDPDKVDSSISVTFTVDWCTGNAVMRVYGKSGTEISLIKGMVGVDIEVGQVLKSGYGLLSKIQSGAGVAGSIVGAASSEGVGGILGGVFNAIGGAAGMVKDAIEGEIPSLNTVGSVGSYADLVGTPTIYATFTDPVPETLSTRGRPLCQRRQLSTLPGYQLVADPYIYGIPGTGQEREMIAAHLTRGYYYA